MRPLKKGQLREEDRHIYPSLLLAGGCFSALFIYKMGLINCREQVQVSLSYPVVSILGSIVMGDRLSTSLVYRNP